jgi:hypothetical protein
MNIFNRSKPAPESVEIPLTPSQQAEKERDALMIQPTAMIPDARSALRIATLQQKLEAFPGEIADLNDTISRRAERRRVISETAEHYLQQAKKGVQFDPAKLTAALHDQTKMAGENDDKENARLQQIDTETVEARDEIKRLTEQAEAAEHEHACREYAAAMWRLSELAQRVRGTFPDNSYRKLSPDSSIGFPFGGVVRIGGKDYAVKAPELAV